MNFEMFLVFPGILVTIGVFLLLCSVILIIIAYKTSDKGAFDVSNENSKKKNKKQKKEEIKEEQNNDLDKTKEFNFGNRLQQDDKIQEFIKLKPVRKEEIIEKEVTPLKDDINDDEEIELL